MATTWSGWQVQLLKAAQLPTGPVTRQFMADWHAHRSSSCTNNPVDISRAMTGATHCAWLTPIRTARNYLTHAQAATAFSREINSGNFPHLLGAMGSVDPYTYTNPQAIANELATWGSQKMAAYYRSKIHTPKPPPGPGGGSSTLPHVHKGWADLRRSFNHRMPRSLDKAERLTRQALRAAGKPGRVG